MRILVVDDEKRITNLIQRGLKENGYEVDAVNDAETAITMAQMNPYDLVLLDIMLPGRDGVSICRELRKNEVPTPILMLTARNSVRDKVHGLNAGADDYLTKPFAFEELLARVKALLRRRTQDKLGILSVANLHLDRATREVRRDSQPITLTSTEYALLEYLMLNANQVVTRTMISENVWKEDFDSFTNVIDVYIRHLREKIDKKFSPPMIRTVRGVGYTLKEP